jgi:Sulfotransferase family
MGRLRETKDPRAPRLQAPPVDQGGKQGSANAPIFVIGCQRSGTSLLRRILDSHSRIACPPESDFIVPLIKVLRDQKSLAGLDSMGFDKDQFSESLAQFINGFFVSYAAARNKPRWADKTPAHLDCLNELAALFGPATRFIIILRHGLDVAYSLTELHDRFPAISENVARAGGNVAIGAGAFWAEQNAKIETFRASSPESCFTVRYEALTSGPEGVVKDMFAFIGEDWEPDVLDYTRFQHDAHSADFEDYAVRRRRRIEPNSGRFKAWPPSVQEQVRDACEPMLTELGYG